MRAIVSFLTRSFAVSRQAIGRDFADVLPSTATGPALLGAAAIVAAIGILDVIHYWPR